MKPPFPEFKPKKEEDVAGDAPDGVEPPVLFVEEEAEEVASISRLRDVPFRMLVPNLITLGRNLFRSFQHSSGLGRAVRTGHCGGCFCRNIGWP